MIVKNMTLDPVAVYAVGDRIPEVYPPQGNLVEVTQIRVPAGNVNGAPIFSLMSDPIVRGLPDLEDGVVIIVTAEARRALHGRPDVVTPDYDRQAVRGAAGRILGVRGFIC